MEFDKETQAHNEGVFHEMMNKFNKNILKEVRKENVENFDEKMDKIFQDLIAHLMISAINLGEDTIAELVRKHKAVQFMMNMAFLKQFC